MTNEWQPTTLGQMVDFVSGGTPSTENKAYWGGDIPWVSAKDMKRFRLHDTEDHVTAEGVSNGTKVVPGGTVFLLSRGMTLLNDVPVCVAHRPMAFNQDIRALRPKEGLRQDYLPYLLLGMKQRLRDLVDLAGHGTGRLNSDELKGLPILIPSDSEQDAIARLFGTIDDKIELNRKMNETLEAMAIEIFRSWFVDFEPVRTRVDETQSHLPPTLSEQFPASFERSEFGEIPKGWEVRGLDEIARFLNGLALQRFPPQDGRSLPVIKIAQLRSGSTDGADAASADLGVDYIVEDGDVLFSWSGSLECLLWAGGRGALNQHLFKVTSDDFPKWFYYLWIKHHLPSFRRIAAAKATTMGHIQRHHLSEAKVFLPSRQLLEAADRLISPLIESIPIREVESRSLALVRDKLLPKLVSGAIRIENPDAIVGAGS